MCLRDMKLNMCSENNIAGARAGQTDRQDNADRREKYNSQFGLVIQKLHVGILSFGK